MPRRFGISVLYALLALALTCEAGATDFRGRQFIGMTNLTAFAREQHGSEIILSSPRLSSKIDWTELIVSWNVQASPEAYLKIEARGVYPDHATKFYTLALWSPEATEHPRESVNSQKDSDGDVLTDTLVLKRSGAEIELRVALGASSNAPLPNLKFIGCSFCDTRMNPAPLPPNKLAWGKSIPVPERSQMAYPGGEVWCSPTSTSMALAHWASLLHRPELRREVPAVAKAVFDKNWPGTGNWPFNTAFAGSFSGMRAYVTRLSDLSELEDWIAKGIPVIASVSYNVLKGTDKRPGDGHLVVCVGFTQEGDPILNDPGVREHVRRVYSRENFAKAWAHSQQTVYLLHPEDADIPADRFGHLFAPASQSGAAKDYSASAR